jgi:type I restriction enzyme S subunit
MKRYDSYKDSGIEWIGEIPEHWEDVKIKQLAVGSNTLFLDGDWIESKEIVFDENNIRYITTGNIGEGKYKDQGNAFITEETFEKLNCTEVFLVTLSFHD